MHFYRDDDVVPLKDVETIIVGKEMELKREKIKEAVQQEKVTLPTQNYFYVYRS